MSILVQAPCPSSVFFGCFWIHAPCPWSDASQLERPLCKKELLENMLVDDGSIEGVEGRRPRQNRI